MKYDAFISYCHGGLDGLIAERLHKEIETFRVPRGIAQKIGKKRIGRVFRDIEELTISSDLSSSIEEGLRDSEFLVLVCSKRTCHSRWVLREVDRFIEMGRRDKIITVLIDGKPDEVFPPQICQRETDDGYEEIEPLAADIRAPSPEKNLKLLKAERLRIMAPILGCTYDDLRQRHKERIFRNILSGAFVVLLLAIAFGAYSSMQLMRINEQMSMKLFNQSFVLAEYSAKALERGDPITATLLALEGLPKNPDKPERPYVAAAEVALADAVGAYEYRETFVPHRSVDLTAKPGGVALSPDEKYLAVLLRNHALILMNTADGSTILTLNAAAGYGRAAVFPASDVMAYIDEKGLTAISIPSGEIVWKKDTALSIAMSEDGSTIAAAGDGYILILDASGKEKRRIDTQGRVTYLPSRTFPPPYDCLELSKNGSLLAVSFTDGSFSVFNTVDGKETQLLSDAAYVTCAFTEDYLACAWLALRPYDAPTAQEEARAEAQSEMYFMAAFSIDTLAKVWEQQRAMLPIAVSLQGQVGFIQSRRLIVYEPNSWRGTTVTVFQEPVLALKEKGGHLLAGLKNGSFTFLSLNADLGKSGPQEATDNALYPGDFPHAILAIGKNFAAVAAAASENVRILKWNSRETKVIYPHSAPNVYSNKRGSHVYFNYIDRLIALDAKTGKTSLNLNNENTRFQGVTFVPDVESGNIVWMRSDSCALYSVTDGTLLFQSDKPCELTETGISVPDGKELSVIDYTTGHEKARYPLPQDSLRPRLYGKWLVSGNGKDIFISHVETKLTRHFADSEILEAFLTDEDILLCSYSKGFVRVHSVRDNIELFRVQSSNEVPGALFMGKGAILALTFYSRPSQTYVLPGGEPVADLSYREYSHMKVFGLPDPELFLTTYIEPLSGSAVGIIRRRDTLDSVAIIPGCQGILDDKSLLIVDTDSVKAVPWYTLTEIRGMAKSFVTGHTLTKELRKRYRVME